MQVSPKRTWAVRTAPRPIIGVADPPGGPCSKAYRIHAPANEVSASQKGYHAPRLSGAERISGMKIAAETAWYSPMVNAPGKAVRQKQRPALAINMTSADPYTQPSRHGIQAGKDCRAK